MWNPRAANDGIRACCSVKVSRLLLEFLHGLGCGFQVLESLAWV